MGLIISLLRNSTIRITYHFTNLQTNNFTIDALVRVFENFQINKYFKEQINGC